MLGRPVEDWLGLMGRVGNQGLPVDQHRRPSMEAGEQPVRFVTSSRPTEPAAGTAHRRADEARPSIRLANQMMERVNHFILWAGTVTVITVMTHFWEPWWHIDTGNRNDRVSLFQPCSLLKLLFPFATGKMQQLINTYIGHFGTTLLELEYVSKV